jgi:hypothetical protein
MQSRGVLFRVLFSLFTAAFLGGASTPVRAQSTSESPSIALTRQLSGLNRPVHITHAGDSSGRLFVVEQTGRVRSHNLRQSRRLGNREPLKAVIVDIS